jgi:histone-arginine methyltransferase CARM1
VHGIASWFDVLFDGSQTQRWLSTAPGLPVTHWFQLRCLLETPLVVAQPGATVRGELRLLAHNRQSYDVHVVLQAPPLTPGGPMQVCVRSPVWCVCVQTNGSPACWCGPQHAA